MKSGYKIAGQKEWAEKCEKEHARIVKRYFNDRMKEVENSLAQELREAQGKFRGSNDPAVCKKKGEEVAIQALKQYAANAAAKSQDWDKFANHHKWDKYSRYSEDERKLRWGKIEEYLKKLTIKD